MSVGERVGVSDRVASSVGEGVGEFALVSSVDEKPGVTVLVSLADEGEGVSAFAVGVVSTPLPVQPAVTRRSAMRIGYTRTV